MEPLVGFEPTTCSLRMSCSTPELQRLMTFSRSSAVMVRFESENDHRAISTIGKAGFKSENPHPNKLVLAWWPVRVIAHGCHP